MTAVSFKSHLKLICVDLATLTIALCIASPLPLIYTLKGIFPITTLFFMLCLLTPITVFMSGYIVSRRYLIRFGDFQLIPQRQQERMKSGIKNIANTGINKTKSAIKAACIATGKFIFRRIVGLVKFILRFLRHYLVWFVPVLLMIVACLMVFSPLYDHFLDKVDVDGNLFDLNNPAEGFLGSVFVVAGLVTLGITLATTAIFALLSMVSVFIFKKIMSKKVSEGKTEQEITKFKRVYFGAVWGFMLVAIVFILLPYAGIISGYLAIVIHKLF